MAEPLNKTAVYLYAPNRDEIIEPELQEIRSFCDSSGFTDYKEYIDRNKSQTVFQEMVNDTRKGEISRIVILRLGRLNDTPEKLLKSLAVIKKINIDFISIKDRLTIKAKDSQSIFSTLSFNNAIDLLSTMTELNRTRSSRIKAGIDRARRKGKRLGRPAISKSVYRKAQKLRTEGLSYRKIGRELNISEGTIRQWIKKLKS